MSRTDDELVALAAKAAGIDTRKPFAPLTDDGDALRLAVKLRMTIAVEREEVRVIGDDAGYYQAWTGPDQSIEVRRGIVEVAAAHVEQLP